MFLLNLGNKVSFCALIILPNLLRLKKANLAFILLAIILNLSVTFEYMVSKTSH